MKNLERQEVRDWLQNTREILEGERKVHTNLYWTSSKKRHFRKEILANWFLYICPLSNLVSIYIVYSLFHWHHCCKSKYVISKLFLHLTWELEGVHWPPFFIFFSSLRSRAEKLVMQRRREGSCWDFAFAFLLLVINESLWSAKNLNNGPFWNLLY